jgi:hypothetical protein
MQGADLFRSACNFFGFSLLCLAMQFLVKSPQREEARGGLTYFDPPVIFFAFRSCAKQRTPQVACFRNPECPSRQGGFHTRSKAIRKKVFCVLGAFSWLAPFP